MIPSGLKWLYICFLCIRECDCGCRTVVGDRVIILQACSRQVASNVTSADVTADEDFTSTTCGEDPSHIPCCPF